MQCDFLKDDKIDAALFCGPTGYNGAESVANILAGQKKVEVTEENPTGIQQVSPSGKLADTYAYDYTQEPAYANAFIRNKSTTGGNIVYQEGIYVGYRWYETANEMGFFDGLQNKYDSAVLYPFGYGLSYTQFKWTLMSQTLSKNTSLNANSKMEFTVRVENIGEYAGKDVVELYYRTPYIEGGIEKSAISLGDFQKTALLQPGEMQDVTLTISAYDMASYDCYDKNSNGHTGYELDKGNYTIELKSDVHTLKTMNTNSISYKVDNTINIHKDPVTDYSVINRFTGEDAYAGVPIDGSNVGVNETYLSRNDFVATYKDKQSALPTDSKKMASAYIYATGANDQDEMPTFGVDKGLYLITKADGSKASAKELDSGKDLKYNDALIDELMENFNSSKWDDLINQVTKTEAKTLVERSGFGSLTIESLGKTNTLDFDGPSGFNENTQKPAEDKTGWMNYPAECVVGCTWNQALANELGRAMAKEANDSGINGWYAPGVNIHRSNYNGRNYEYYSEDPIISGKLSSATIMGAKAGGLYCYLKHFVVSEEGDNPKGVDTWITEQALREVYLKPFEIAVKAGANGIMTAFNRVGAVWAGANYDLLTEVLRNEWGFKGSVVTDWSSGDSIMNTGRGVLAGNDLWLNPMAQNYAPLKESDATQMYCAKNAVKNNIYTFISTYHYAKNYDSENDPYKTDTSIKVAGKASEWWIPTLITLDVVVGIGTVVLGLFLFGPFKKDKKNNSI